MRDTNRQQLRLSGGTDLSFITAGESSKPAVLLLRGTPQSARYFRDVMPELSRAAHVIAPDLPDFGESDLLPAASFPAYGQAISELLDRLAIGPRYIYLHDFGAPVGFHIAMQAPERVLGLIVQNGNAHRTGLGQQWGPVLAYGSQPNPENEAAATAHLTYEGMRDTYVRGVPSDVAARIPAESWEEDWRVMQLPGRLDKERALIADYARYVARFDAIADYLQRRQPPALMVWGRHEPFFELAEVLSWMEDLPRMEAHILDGGHMLLETHAAEAASLMVDFIKRTQRIDSPHWFCFPADVFRQSLSLNGRFIVGGTRLGHRVGARAASRAGTKSSIGRRITPPVGVSSLVFALFGPAVASSLRERRRTVAGRARQRALVTPATMVRRLDATPGPHVLQ